MKLYLTAAILISAIAYSSAYADTLDLATLRLQLQTIQTQLDRLNIEMDGMAQDIKEIKECNALARQAPISLAELRDMAKPSNKADDSKLVEMYKHDAVARMRCGLSPGKPR